MVVRGRRHAQKGRKGEAKASIHEEKDKDGKNARTLVNLVSTA